MRLSAIVALFAAFFGVRAGKCPRGAYISHNRDKCFHVLPVSLHFNGAQATCALFGGQLATVISKQDNEIIQERALLAVQNMHLRNKKFWLGSTDLGPGGDWKWVDGQPVAYERWAKNEPSTDPGCHCLAIDSKTGLWYAEVCSKENSYVCEVTIESPATPATCPPTPTCPTCPTCPTQPDLTCPPIQECEICPSDNLSEWVSFENALYYHNKDKKNSTEAENWCAQHGAHLASIHNKQENDFLVKLIFPEVVSTRIAAWVGGHTPNKAFAWVDNSTMAYSNWFDGSPPEIEKNAHDNCVELLITGEGARTQENAWWSNYCSRKVEFVCKK